MEGEFMTEENNTQKTNKTQKKNHKIKRKKMKEAINQ